MKRLATFSVLSALALAVPAASASAATDYQGTTSSGGSLAFTKDGSKLKRFVFEAVPINCKKTDGATVSGNLTFNEKIKKGKFKIRAVDLKRNDDVNARLVVNGTIKGDNASGNFSVKGDRVKIDQGGREKCSTGKLDFNATSGPVRSSSAKAASQAFSRR